MSLQSEHQLINAEKKLVLIENQIAIARARKNSPENAESLDALVRMANQMREEIVIYRGRRKRAS